MVGCCLLTSAANTQANEAKDTGVRMWLDVSGTYCVKAEFAGLENDDVKLRKSDGSEIAVQLDLLSPEDREWVRTHVSPSSKTCRAVHANTEQALNTRGASDVRIDVVSGSFQFDPHRISYTTR